MDMTDFQIRLTQHGAGGPLYPGTALPPSPRQVTELDRCVGARLRATRQHRGLSQSAVAERLGVSFQQVQKYENGTNRMSVSTFVTVAEALGLSPLLLLDRCLQDLEAVPSTNQPPSSHLRADAGRAEQTMRLLEGFGRLRDARLRQQVLDFLALLAHDMDQASSGRLDQVTDGM